MSTSAVENKPAWNFCLPENGWRMEGGGYGKEMMEKMKGKRERERERQEDRKKRKPVSGQYEAAQMAREYAEQTKMQRKQRWACNTVVSQRR